MNYQWYPGHMTKAMRMMKQNIGLVDIVIELTDARIPKSGLNPDLKKLAGNKTGIILLNKADLADEKITKNWISYFSSKGYTAIEINAKNKKSVKLITKKINDVMKEKRAKDLKKGIISTSVRAMVVGIPNVGKSTLINSMCGRALTRTGDKPGVTKGKQWLSGPDGIQFLDTPGVLWPKFENKKIGENLAMIGSLRDENIDVTELSLELVRNIKNNYPGNLEKRYNITEKQIDPSTNENREILDSILLADAELGDCLLYLYAVAKNKSMIKKGQSADLDRAGAMIVDDFRKGRLGRISLERVNE